MITLGWKISNSFLVVWSTSTSTSLDLKSKVSKISWFWSFQRFCCFLKDFLVFKFPKRFAWFSSFGKKLGFEVFQRFCWFWLMSTVWSWSHSEFSSCVCVWESVFWVTNTKFRVEESNKFVPHWVTSSRPSSSPFSDSKTFFLSLSLFLSFLSVSQNNSLVAEDFENELTDFQNSELKLWRSDPEISRIRSWSFRDQILRFLSGLQEIRSWKFRDFMWVEHRELCCWHQDLVLIVVSKDGDMLILTEMHSLDWRYPYSAISFIFEHLT